MVYYCVEDMKGGFTVGKAYRVKDDLHKEKMPSSWDDWYGNKGTAHRDSFKIRKAWHGEYEDITEYNSRVAGMNAYIKKKKQSADTKKRRKKPLIDLINDDGHIKSIREGQLKRYFTPIKSEVEALIRDRKLNKLVK